MGDCSEQQGTKEERANVCLEASAVRIRCLWYEFKVDFDG